MPFASKDGFAEARSASRSGVAVWVLLLGLLIAARLASGVEKAFHFSGPPVDGPFQLFNVLRRIAAGQRGGADFQYFHGLGVPYAHYLPFRLMGGDLVASELARQILSIVAYPIVLVVFFRAFTRDWSRTLALSVIVYAVSIALPLGTVTTPMVSMLGVRSTLPTLLPVAWFAFAEPRTRVIATGLVLGAAFLLGSEQAVAVLAAFVVVGGIGVWVGNDRRTRLREIAAVVGIALATLVVGLVAIGGPRGAAQALRYNFSLVPKDQYWYFGAPASVFAPDWPSVAALMRQMPRIPLAIVAALVLIVVQVRRLWRDPDGDVGRRNAALSMLAIYGLISCAAILGIFYDTYVEPCLRAVLLIGALELDRFILVPNRRRRAGRTLAWTAAGALLAMIVAVPSTVGAMLSTLPHVVAEHVLRRAPATPTDIWPQTLAEGQRIVDQHRDANGRPPVVWSTYSGWIEAKNGIFNPTPFDYTMHALGPENRAAYLAQFRAVKPTLVQTVLPTYLTAEIWLEQTSWDFYEELLQNYRAVGATPWSIFWERLPSSGEAPTVFWSSDVNAGATSVEIPVADRFHGDTSVVLLSVRLEYETHNPWALLPFVGGLPRYFVSVDRALARLPVTLDPYTTTASFPVVAVRGQNPTLRFATYSLLPGPRLTVRRIRVSTIPITQNNAGWLASLVAEEQRRQPLGPGSDSTGRYRWR